MTGHARWAESGRRRAVLVAASPGMADGAVPVVIRRWASGRPRGVPHLEIVCDESGFSGGNLVGGHAPVFAHASLRIGGAAAAAVIAGLRRRMDGGPPGELKAGALLRPRHRDLVHDLLGPDGPLADLVVTRVERGDLVVR